MVGWKRNHQDAHPHYLHLRGQRGWQDNHYREHEQKQDVHSLQSAEEIPQRQVHPSSQSKETILTEGSIMDLDN